jgi:diguanylate cyclase (GGDEF)-like protein
MTSTNRYAVLFVALYMAAFYAWILTFRENESIRVFGASVFPIIGGTISFIWLFQTYRVIKEKTRYFWLLLSWGVLFYLAGNLIMIYYQFVLGVISPYPSVADLMWVISYSLFLAALMFKTKVVKDSVSVVPSIYNILIFMTIATTLSVYYLLERILFHSDYSFGIMFLTIAYPMFDLGFLFAALSLLYLSMQRKLLLFIVAAFSFQIIADSTYVYLSITGDYLTGHLIDPLWQLALLLNGLAGLYSQRTPEILPSSRPFQLKIHDNIFPYVGFCILLTFLIYNQLSFINSLSIGVIAIVFLIIMRQFTIMKENIELAKKYKYLAYHDPLTGLQNRASFEENIFMEIEKARSNHSKVALIFIDLDSFKKINDSLGHSVGDSLLKSFADRLQNVIKGNQKVYRLGGDEFIIVFPEAVSTECIAIAEELIKDSTHHYIIDGQEILVTPSIGISLFPDHGENEDELFKSADISMYSAKQRGKNNFQFYHGANTDE